MPQQTSGAAVLSHRQPRAIVRGKHHQRILRYAPFFKRSDDRADTPVEFLDDIAIKAAEALASKRLASKQRRVRHAVGQIKQKRRVCAALDKRHRLFGIALRVYRLLSRTFNQFVLKTIAFTLTAKHGNVPVLDLRIEVALAARCDDRLECIGVAAHVHTDQLIDSDPVRPIHIIGIGNAVPVIKTVARGVCFWRIPQMPLADDAGRVTLGFQRFGNRQLGFGDANAISRKQHPDQASVEACPVWQPARQQCAAARRAHGRGNVEVCPALAFPGKRVEIRRAAVGMPVAAEIAVAKIISKEDHDVRCSSRSS